MTQHQKTTKAVVYASNDNGNHQTTERFELVMEDGTSLADIIEDFESRIAALE